MDSGTSERAAADTAGSPHTTGPAPGAARPPLSSSAANGLKIVIVGGFGVGKTTMVRSVSEIRPLNTEETMTQAGVGIDDLSGVGDKTTTTIAFDFGRIGIDDRTVLYLFGAPGQERFWFLWDRLFSGTLGAVVLIDTRRLEDSWYAIDRLEQHGTPFVVARNDFGGPVHTHQQIREALDLPDDVPLMDCDARSRHSSRDVLLRLVRHVYALSTGNPAGAVEVPAERARATGTGAADAALGGPDGAGAAAGLSGP